MESFLVGVAGFELATSASLRRRSNQAEPHPVFQQLDNNIIANRQMQHLFFLFQNTSQTADISRFFRL